MRPVSGEIVDDRGGEDRGEAALVLPRKAQARGERQGQGPWLLDEDQFVISRQQ